MGYLRKSLFCLGFVSVVSLSACGGPPPVKGEPADGGATETTAGVLCDHSGTYTTDYSTSGKLTSNWRWTCDETTRTLTSNALPNHAVGEFPNPGNPNTISEQKVIFTAPLKPVMDTMNKHVGGPGGIRVFALNGVKFDPSTGGACPGSMKSVSDCDLGAGNGPWRLEALGQDTSDFGEDSNNAHVQPGGEYHYHGMPEGLIAEASVSDETNKKMMLIGWAADGYPVYARFCHTNAMDPASPIKICQGSFSKKDKPDSGRPSTDIVPMGAFAQDWEYKTGSGDLDECNGRTGVTPEFPKGIYYYMATDSYPYFSRCLKGKVN